MNAKCHEDLNTINTTGPAPTGSFGMSPCPNCGYCPTCGRAYRAYPYWGWTPWYGGTFTCGNVAAAVGLTTTTQLFTLNS